MVALTLAATSMLPALVQEPKRFEGAVVKKVSLNYLVTLPEGYETDKSKKWPLLLFLHGAGERGNDLEKLKVNGVTMEVAKGRKLPFVVVSPQCPERQWWDTDVLIPFCDYLEKTYRIDTKREYLTGLSMGGFGSWAMAIAQPNRWAAVLPICGGGEPIQVAAIKDMPIWVVHGDADTTVPIAQSKAMVDALKAAGATNVRFDILPGIGHDSWSQTYSQDAVYEWFAKQHK